MKVFLTVFIFFACHSEQNMRDLSEGESCSAAFNAPTSTAYVCDCPRTKDNSSCDYPNPSWPVSCPNIQATDCPNDKVCALTKLDGSSVSCESLTGAKIISFSCEGSDDSGNEINYSTFLTKNIDAHSFCTNFCKTQKGNASCNPDSVFVDTL